MNFQLFLYRENDVKEFVSDIHLQKVIFQILGYWLAHSYSEFNDKQGMSVIVKTGEVEDMPSVSPLMRRCGDFSELDGQVKTEIKAKQISG